VPSIVTVSSGTFMVTLPSGARTGDPDITFTVRDSAGATKLVTVKVGEPPSPTIVPASININAGNTATFSVSSGTPGYTMLSDNAAVRPSPSFLNTSGDTFTATVPSNMAAATVTFTALDSAGKTATATLNITGRSDQTISFGAPPTMSVGDTGTVSASATSGLPVSFSSITNSVCTISGTIVTGLAAGTCTIVANQAGNIDYNAAPQMSQTFAISKATQTIILGAAPSVIVGGTGTVSATGGASGNPVVYTSLTTSVCTISGTTVTGVTSGTCRIAADQAGNINYNVAPQVIQTITIP